MKYQIFYSQDGGPGQPVKEVDSEGEAQAYCIPVNTKSRETYGEQKSRPTAFYTKVGSDDYNRLMKIHQKKSLKS